jgi:hypothetical protein
VVLSTLFLQKKKVNKCLVGISNNHISAFSVIYVCYPSPTYSHLVLTV